MHSSVMVMKGDEIDERPLNRWAQRYIDHRMDETLQVIDKTGKLVTKEKPKRPKRAPRQKPEEIKNWDDIEGPWYAIRIGKDRFRGIVFELEEFKELTEGARKSFGRKYTERDDDVILDALDFVRHSNTRYTEKQKWMKATPLFFAFRHGKNGARGLVHKHQLWTILEKRPELNTKTVEKRAFENCNQGLLFCELAGTESKAWTTLERSLLYLAKNRSVHMTELLDHYMIREEEDELPTGPLPAETPEQGETASENDGVDTMKTGHEERKDGDPKDAEPVDRERKKRKPQDREPEDEEPEDEEIKNLVVGGPVDILDESSSEERPMGDVTDDEVDLPNPNMLDTADARSDEDDDEIDSALEKLIDGVARNAIEDWLKDLELDSWLKDENVDESVPKGIEVPESSKSS
ncbi:hypothetical protein FVE85_3604 [Porphyridium purpureum]|uniref:Uncharacterized protein n=1 Tax=Porphyridium purpureum TaxID=35688 RepID=A0A5J4YL65_PORPP|nr:hypothetical protein FVE85_3604 [Porphyridium purpureum]|eukprot:POR1873..scf249_10